jgi:uncharacterized protein YcaQ
VTPHRLSRQDARRIAVRAQLLEAPRPTDVLDTIRGLGTLQHDPVSAVAPSAHLVLWSRLGSSYATYELEDAVAEQRVIELFGHLRPAEDVVLHRAEMEAWPDESVGWQVSQDQWVHDNEGCRLDILERLRADGPLPLKALPDTTVRPWRSSGWNNNKNVPMLLDCLVVRGEVAVAGREGRVKLFDLASRVYPDDTFPDVEEARRLQDVRRLGVLGLARASGTVLPGESIHVADAGEPAEVEGVSGTWRVDPARLEDLGRPFTGRAALLSPLDRLVIDRKRMAEIFAFDYALEMYKPAAKRRWGYYALPILHGDRLVGKLDATADRKAGELRVDAVHEDGDWSAEVRDAVAVEIADLARWLDLALVRT